MLPQVIPLKMLDYQKNCMSVKKRISTSIQLDLESWDALRELLMVRTGGLIPGILSLISIFTEVMKPYSCKTTTTKRSPSTIKVSPEQIKTEKIDPKPCNNQKMANLIQPEALFI